MVPFVVVFLHQSPCQLSDLTETAKRRTAQYFGSITHIEALDVSVLIRLTWLYVTELDALGLRPRQVCFPLNSGLLSTRICLGSPRLAWSCDRTLFTRSPGNNVVYAVVAVITQ